MRNPPRNMVFNTPGETKKEIKELEEKHELSLPKRALKKGELSRVF
jgi:hypothetical protein